MDQCQLSQLIARIYQTALNPEQWNSMLAELADVCHAVGVNVMLGDLIEHDLQHLWLSPSLKPLFDAYYAQKLYRVEQPFFDTVGKMGIAPQLHDIQALQYKHNQLSEEKIDLQSLTQWLVKEWGIHDRFATGLNEHPSYFDTVCFSFKKMPRDRLLDSVAIGNLLTPHLANLIQISRPFLLLKTRFNAVLEVLDRFQLGVFLLNQQGDLISHNNRGQAVLDQQDGIGLDMKNRLKLSSPDGAAWLHQSLANTKTHCVGNHQAYSRGVVRRSSGKRPYLAEVAPLLHHDLPIGALLLVLDPEVKGVINTEGFQMLFHLTQAEQAICQLLVDGYKAQDVADLRNTGLETVKGQIKSIFSKTGVNEKSALIRLAVSVNLPVDKKETHPPKGG